MSNTFRGISQALVGAAFVALAVFDACLGAAWIPIGRTKAAEYVSWEHEPGYFLLAVGAVLAMGICCAWTGFQTLRDKPS